MNYYHDHADHNSSSHGDENNTIQHPFCHSMSGGAGMSMYMSGFRWSLLDSSAPCLNFLFPSWTLDTRTKFYAAMMMTMGLGVILEVLPIWKARLYTIMSHNNMGTGRDDNRQQELQETRTRGVDMETVLLSMFHGIQAFLGYMLMLVAMTYSVELILSVMIGISLGFFLSYKSKRRLESSSHPRRQQVPGNLMGVGNCNPCCEFLDRGMSEHDHQDNGYFYSELRIGDDDGGGGVDEHFRSLHHRTATTTTTTTTASTSGG